MQDGCRHHSYLRHVDIEYVLGLMITSSQVDAHLATLSPLIFALAAYAKRKFSGQQHDEWRNFLQGRKMFVSRGQNASNLKCLEDVFQPDLGYLQEFDTYKINILLLDGKSRDDMQEDIISSLIRWGMKNHFTWRDFLDEAKSVANSSLSTPSPSSSRVFQRANALLKYMEERSLSFWRFGASSDDQTFNQVPFIPCEIPKSWDFSLDQPSEAITELKAASMLLPYSAREVVWAVECCTLHHWKIPSFRKLEPSMIVSQIEKLATFHRDGQASKKLVDHLLVACKRLKTLVPDLSQMEELLRPLVDLAWVPVERQQGLFLLPPARVAHDWDHKLDPGLGLLPKEWAGELGSTVLKAVGITKHFSVNVLSHQLEDLANQDVTPGSLLFAVNLAKELALILADSSKRNNDINLPVPTVSRRLRPVSEVYINDAKWVGSGPGGEQVEILDEAIGPKDARLLGCGSVREKLAQMCEAHDDFGEDFGQHEDLVARIRGILGQYNEEHDIFIEHLQNCDDAGADKVTFVLDRRSYATQKLVDDRAQILQGPALLLTSSKSLTDEDIKRIQLLGNSSKRGDFSKCGRFGIGINCFFAVTDTIQLLSNGHLHIFDPMNTVVTCDDQRGRKYKCEALQERFPDMLKPFSDFHEYPTVFRLPLRTHKSQFQLGKPAVTVHEVMDRMRGANGLISKAEDLLVFSKFVSKLHVAVQQENTLHTEYLMQLEKSEEHVYTGQKLSAIMRSLPRTMEQVSALQHSPRETVARIRIAGRIGCSQCDSQWLLSHSLSADDEVLQLVKESLQNGGVAMLPHGATALRTSGTKRENGSGICCYLPLRNLPLPVEEGNRLVLLIHGCFNVSSSRKEISMPQANQQRP